MLNDQIKTKSTPTQLMLQDLKDGLLNWRIWLLLSWQDIRLRYRRSQLGPFWLTISMGITIYFMGFLYGHLFQFDIQHYFPYLAAGMLTWSLISLMMIEGLNTFIESAGFLQHMKLPYSIFILRVMTRSLIVFLHNMLVIIPLYFVCHIHVTWAVLLIIPALFLLLVNAFFFGIVLAIIGARFRDLGQLIVSLTQIIFFMTPIMWRAESLPAVYQKWVAFNPFVHFVNLVRAPLISQVPSMQSIYVVLGMTVLGIILAMRLFVRVRHRIVYWL